MESPFRGPLPPTFRLIETLGWRPEAGFAHLALHLARLERTAATFTIPFDRARIDRALCACGASIAQRIRLTLASDGAPEVIATPLSPDPAIWKVRIAPARLDPDDPWLRVKTTERRLYDTARAAMPPGADELIFLNSRDEICEGAITNVFLERGGTLLTPPVTSGLLPGILRETLLANGGAREHVLHRADLTRGQLFVGNALRGLRPAILKDFIQA